MFVDEHADADVAVRVTGHCDDASASASAATASNLYDQLTPKLTLPLRATPLRHFSFMKGLCSKVQELQRKFCNGK